MAQHDLDAANAVHSALVTLFAQEQNGARNALALARVEALSEAAVNAVNDLEARVAIRGVKSLAALLFSDDGHLGITAGNSFRGAEAVRLQIMNALSAFRGRLELLEARKPSRPEIPALAPRHLRILVVEDNRDSAESLKRLLETCGYAVTTASSASAGLEAAKHLRPDVVLCDIGLPDSDGFSLAQELRNDAATAGARLIAVTAYGRDEDRERAKAVGIDLYLVKPVFPGTILQVLEETKRRVQPGDSNVVPISAAKLGDRT